LPHDLRGPVLLHSRPPFPCQPLKL
jgi:hypothetical protein